MHAPAHFRQAESKKPANNRCCYPMIGVVLVAVVVVTFIVVLRIRHLSDKRDATHIQYTRLSTKPFNGGYELYGLTVQTKGNPEQQYKLLGNFLRRSLFNKSNYESYFHKCPIIYAMTAVDHPEDWRAMLFGTTKYPLPQLPYPYVCFLSVLSSDRQHKLGSILLNHFINEMFKSTTPPVTHMQLHANWENCRAQRLYRKCGFRCNEFTPNGYPPPFEPEYKFGHMIRMELNMANIKNRTSVCFDKKSLEISAQVQAEYDRLCNANVPQHLNQTC